MIIDRFRVFEIARDRMAGAGQQQGQRGRHQVQHRRRQCGAAQPEGPDQIAFAEERAGYRADYAEIGDMFQMFRPTA